MKKSIILGLILITIVIYGCSQKEELTEGTEKIVQKREVTKDVAEEIVAYAIEANPMFDVKESRIYSSFKEEGYWKVKANFRDFSGWRPNVTYWVNIDTATIEFLESKSGKTAISSEFRLSPPWEGDPLKLPDSTYNAFSVRLPLKVDVFNPTDSSIIIKPKLKCNKRIKFNVEPIEIPSIMWRRFEMSIDASKYSRSMKSVTLECKVAVEIGGKIYEKDLEILATPGALY